MPPEDLVTYKVSSEQLHSEVGSEGVILDLKSGVYYGLNETGNQIWQWLQQPKSEAEILALVLQEYDVTPEQGASDVKDLLAQLSQAGIIEIATKTTATV